MTKERELLACAGLVIAEYRWSDPEDKELRELSEQINAYFEEPEVESKPIAYWDTQNGKLIQAVPLSSERTCFEVPLVPLYLHPRADIVDELVYALEYCIKQIPEFADVPGIKAALAKARGESHE